MEYKEWLASTPEDFPIVFHKATPNHNPVIGADQIHTINNVHDVLGFIQDVIVSGQGGELQLNATETSGIDLILDACNHALHFETTCRPDGGEPLEDANSSDVEGEQ